MASYWTKKSGNDANPGTEGSPKLTISAGIGLLAGGDTLNIGVGVYVETITTAQFVGKSGASYAAATIVQADGSDVVSIKPSAGTSAIQLTNTGATVRFVIFKNIKLDGSSSGAITTDVNGVGLGGGGNGGTIERIKFDNVEVHDWSGNGYQMGGDDSCGNLIWITGGSIHDGGGGREIQPDQRHVIYAEGSDCLVEHVEMYNWTGYGVHNYGPTPQPSRNVYRFNRIHDTGQYTDDTTFGVLLMSGVDNEAYGNLIYNNQGGANLASSGNQLYNNTLYGNGQGFGAPCCYDAILVNNGSNNVVKNNLLNNNAVNSIDITGSTSTTLADNLTTGTTASHFVNAGAEDFHLVLGSSAIDAAEDLGSPYDEDFDGVSRPQGAEWDIGAYELEDEAEFIPASAVNSNVML